VVDDIVAADLEADEGFWEVVNGVCYWISES
jgi:hypothetical protein